MLHMRTGAFLHATLESWELDNLARERYKRADITLRGDDDIIINMSLQ